MGFTEHILGLLEKAGNLISLFAVAAIIVIRTMLGWTTTLEISGRWLWQRQ